MRPADFSYSRPGTVHEVLAAIANGAVPLAGGQSLLQSMRLREFEPSALVDITGVRELDDDIVLDDAAIRIGALATHATLASSSILAGEAPWLAEAARRLGDVQVRNRGTALGNLCWADPRANMAVALLASRARVVATDGRSETRIELEDFFTGFRQNSLGARLALAIEVPRGAPAHGCYVEFSRQRQDLALVNVCAVRRGDDLQVAVGGINPRPTLLDNAQLPAFEQCAPIVDQHGSAKYKWELAETMVGRALQGLGA